ncbi:MAG: hemerythrin family protein [Acidimicrobiales bacterium]|nr:hemerythrin family protein [Acidimicrobiales bacterium]
MTFMPWEDRYKLGVGPMDAQHRGLVDAMNKVHDSVSAGATGADLLRMVDSLAALTQRHFASEEAYMQSIQFADLEQHRTIHGLLMRQLTEHRERIAKTGKPDPKLFSFLKLWLQSHICGIDAKYARAKIPAANSI